MHKTIHWLHMKNLFATAVFVFLCTPANGGVPTDRDYSFQPYPVLLLHGFNSTPFGSWGLVTEKKKNDELGISTKLTSLEEISRQKNKIGETLIKKFQGYPAYGNTPIHLEEARSAERMLPHEEKGSYSGVNHSFVEAYCSYWSVESNDKDGTRHSLSSVHVQVQ